MNRILETGKYYQITTEVLLKYFLIKLYRAGGNKRLLIIDGHTSHVAWEFFDFCLEHDIIPLCLPAYSTHLLQPLDVGLFGPLQGNYSRLLDDFIERENCGIHKGTFFPLSLPIPDPIGI